MVTVHGHAVGLCSVDFILKQFAKDDQQQLYRRTYTTSDNPAPLSSITILDEFKLIGDDAVTRTAQQIADRDSDRFGNGVAPQLALPNQDICLG